MHLYSCDLHYETYRKTDLQHSNRLAKMEGNIIHIKQNLKVYKFMTNCNHAPDMLAHPSQLLPYTSMFRKD